MFIFAKKKINYVVSWVSESKNIEILHSSASNEYLLSNNKYLWCPFYRKISLKVKSLIFKNCYERKIWILDQANLSNSWCNAKIIQKLWMIFKNGLKKEKKKFSFLDQFSQAQFSRSLEWWLETITTYLWCHAYLLPNAIKVFPWPRFFVKRKGKFGFYIWPTYQTLDVMPKSSKNCKWALKMALKKLHLGPNFSKPNFPVHLSDGSER